MRMGDFIAGARDTTYERKKKPINSNCEAFIFLNRVFLLRMVAQFASHPTKYEGP